MKKKGFTLIELLAVIVILAILLAIAIPKVTQYITKSRKDSLIATEKTFVMFMNKHRAITPCSNRCKRHEIVSGSLSIMV